MWCSAVALKTAHPSEAPGDVPWPRSASGRRRGVDILSHILSRGVLGCVGSGNAARLGVSDGEPGRRTVLRTGRWEGVAMLSNK